MPPRFCFSCVTCHSPSIKVIKGSLMVRQWAMCRAQIRMKRRSCVLLALRPVRANRSSHHHVLSTGTDMQEPSREGEEAPAWPEGASSSPSWHYEREEQWKSKPVNKQNHKKESRSCFQLLQTFYGMLQKPFTIMQRSMALFNFGCRKLEVSFSFLFLF